MSDDEITPSIRTPLFRRDLTNDEAARMTSGLNPKTLNQLEREAQERIMADEVKNAAVPEPVSPTGKPIVPASFVPYLSSLLVILGGIAALPTMGISLLPAAICNGALIGSIVVGALLGASPGWRKKPE